MQDIPDFWGWSFLKTSVNNGQISISMKTIEVDTNINVDFIS
jgi:hypothetical protein